MLSKVQVHEYRLPSRFLYENILAGQPQIQFAGGEPHVEILPTKAEIVIDLRYADAQGLLTALAYNDAYSRIGVQPHLFCPYLPGARQDRVEPNRVFTAKLFADLINAANFKSVICLDPHSDVMPALLNHCHRIPAEDVFPSGQGSFPGPSRAVMICPDQGAIKRTEAVAFKFGYNVEYASKHRDALTGKLSGFHIQPIHHGAHAIIVDDICDGGGTFIGIAEEIRRLHEGRDWQPELHLWTTHGIYSKGIAPLLGHFKSVMCTDSFPSPFIGRTEPEFQSPGLTTVPLMTTLRNTMERIIR